MSYSNPEDKKSHNKRYYSANKERLLKYRKGRRKKDNENWRKWYLKKKNQERRKKISLGDIYKPKSPYG